MRMPRRSRGATFAGMLFRARRLSDRIRGFDRVRADELIGLVLLIEIELQVWLSPYVHHRVPAALGGVALSVGGGGAPSLAARSASSWALARSRRQDVFGGRLTEHALGAIPAGSWSSTAPAPSFQRRRARWALGARRDGAAGRRADHEADVLGILLRRGIMLGLLPWTVGRMLRERGARESAYRESAERLDAEREQRARAAASASGRGSHESCTT